MQSFNKMTMSDQLVIVPFKCPSAVPVINHSHVSMFSDFNRFLACVDVFYILIF